MRRRVVRWSAVVSLVGAAAAGAIYLFVWVSGGTGEASTPISAPPLPMPTTPAAPKQASAPAMVASTAQEKATAAISKGVPTSAVLYRIIPEESQVRFEIDEILRGQPVHVMGTTDQVAGDFIVNFADLSASQLGTVRINVRTLRTPEQRRDQAIRSRILESANDKYEFTVFEPVRLIGLPSAVQMGKSEAFQIVGNLTIREITNEVTFNAELRLIAPNRLAGAAVATIQRRDYDLSIPSVPFVASVGENVILGIDFVAAAVSN